jgi:hypothetical protein
MDNIIGSIFDKSGMTVADSGCPFSRPDSAKSAIGTIPTTRRGARGAGGQYCSKDQYVGSSGNDGTQNGAGTPRPANKSLESWICDAACSIHSPDLPSPSASVRFFDGSGPVRTLALLGAETHPAPEEHYAGKLRGLRAP